jgi:hypothetical protein
MFSSFSKRFGAKVFDRLDVLVEFSTLGEYGVDEEGIFALEGAAERCPDNGGSRLPVVRRTRGDCSPGGPAAVSRSCRDAAARP